MNSKLSTPNAEPASLWLRLIAAVYDAMPLLALWFAATLLALVLTGGGLDVRRLPHRLLVQTLALAVTAAYFMISWRRGGQTIGMRPWRLRVVSADGHPVTMRQAAIRFAVALISLTAAGVGFLWALIDSQRRTWHDIVAGTLLVRLDRD